MNEFHPKLGYACINNTLAEQGIQVNRMMIKRTFQAKGIKQASALALKNISDFAKVIEWNIKHDLFFYRMSSDMFPWMSEYELVNLPDIDKIKAILKRTGEKVKQHDMRLTFHPGPFNVLASPNNHVVEKTIKELRQHGEIMDMIGLPRNHKAKINIHVGGAYGDKKAAMNRFSSVYKDLPDTCSARLTIENDDKANMFSVNDLLYLHESIGIPIVFDYLHHVFCTGELTEREAVQLAAETWPREVTPVVHYSSSKKMFEDSQALPAAHADFIYQPVKRYGIKADIMLEAKAKEQAVFRYKEDFLTSQKAA